MKPKLSPTISMMSSSFPSAVSVMAMVLIMAPLVVDCEEFITMTDSYCSTILGCFFINITNFERLIFFGIILLRFSIKIIWFCINKCIVNSISFCCFKSLLQLLKNLITILLWKLLTRFKEFVRPTPGNCAMRVPPWKTFQKWMWARGPLAIREAESLL